MPIDTGGPVTGQDIKVYRGAPKTVGVTLPDPSGILAAGSAEWWVGVVRFQRSGVPGSAQIAGSPQAVNKPGLAVTAPVPGSVRITWVIEPDDIASIQPDPYYDRVQHEVWFTSPGAEPEPVTIGQLNIIGTLRGNPTS